MSKLVYFELKSNCSGDKSQKFIANTNYNLFTVSLKFA